MSDPRPDIGGPSPGRRSGPLVAYRVLVNVFTLLVLVQAVLAGQFLNGEGQLVTVHRRIGETLPVVALVLVILALSARRRVSPGALLVPSVVLMLLTVAQTGLGFVGRDTLGARSLHIPVGVALFGLGIYCLGAVKRLRTAPAG